MQTNNECATTVAQMSSVALEAMNRLILMDNVSGVKESVTQFFHEWIRSEFDFEQPERCKRLWHYQLMMELLESAEQIDNIKKSGREVCHG